MERPRTDRAKRRNRSPRQPIEQRQREEEMRRDVRGALVTGTPHDARAARGEVGTGGDAVFCEIEHLSGREVVDRVIGFEEPSRDARWRWQLRVRIIRVIHHHSEVGVPRRDGNARRRDAMRTSTRRDVPVIETFTRSTTQPASGRVDKALSQQIVEQIDRVAALGRGIGAVALAHSGPDRLDVVVPARSSQIGSPAPSSV